MDEPVAAEYKVAMTVSKMLTATMTGLAAAAVGLTVGSGQPMNSNPPAAIWSPMRLGTYERWVCTGCGLVKSVEVSKVGTQPPRREISFDPTAVSRAIGTNGCQHSWLLYACGRIDGEEFIMSNLPGGRPPTFCCWFLIADQDFANELAAMERPHEKWHLLVTALSTNGALDRSLAEWRTATPRRSYTAWWQQSPLSSTNKPRGNAPQQR